MKRIISTISGAILTLCAIGQDVHFSQFYNTPVQLNPGMTGVMQGNLRLNTAYRNQWASVASPFKTFLFNGDYRFDTKGSSSIGAGLNVYRDMAGQTNFSTTNIQLAVSGILNINNNNLVSLGINGGVLQKSMDPNSLVWGNQYQNGTYDSSIDPGETINMDPGFKADVSAGLVYVYHSDQKYMTSNDQLHIKVGFAYNHITSPEIAWTNITTDKLYSNMVAHGEANIGIGNSKLSVVPGFLVMLQGPSTEITAGSLFKYRLQDASQVTGYVKGAYLSLGAYMRFGDAFIPTLQFEFDKYAMGISYDLNTSSLRAASGMKGGFEITLRYQMDLSGPSSKASL